MSNAAQQARKLLDSLGWSSPTDMTVEDIAWSSGLIVTQKEMYGCEGRILMNKDSGIISINAKVDYQPKINWILAHEIGHSILHRNLSFFSDNDKTLAEWYAKGEHETEANQFAAELLMPSDLFSRKVKQKKMSLQLIEEISAFFNASKTATFLRYRDLGDYPVMIIYIENGFIKWKSHSTDFPFTWIPYKSAIPAWTVAGDFYYNGVKEINPVKVGAIEWFPEDFNLQNGNETQQLWEQCFPVTRDSILTCLWTF